MKKCKKYLDLFLYTLQLSSLTFGGGYVIVSMMKKQLVDKYGLLKEEEMLDYAAIAQSSPGSLAVNACVLVGYRLLGFSGALIAVAGTIIPPLAILSVISLGYSAFAQNAVVGNALKGMQAGVCAVLIDTIMDLSGTVIKSRSALQIFLMAGAFFSVAIFKINVIFIVLACVLIGLICAVMSNRGRGRHDIS